MRCFIVGCVGLRHLLFLCAGLHIGREDRRIFFQRRDADSRQYPQHARYHGPSESRDMPPAPFTMFYLNQWVLSLGPRSRLIPGGHGRRVGGVALV
jgi:hypothetical protein